MGSLVALVLLIFLALQIPAVQNWVKDKAVAFLEKKLGTDVEVRKLSIQFPKGVSLEGVYFEDQKGDTLLAGERLAVQLSMLKLLKSEVEVQSVELEGIHANVKRIAPDTVFNFQYIVDAFVVADTTPVDTSAAPLKLAVDKVSLQRVVLTFHDDVTGNDAYASIGDFETRLGELDLEKQAYEIKNVELADFVVRVRQYKPLVELKSVAVRQAEAAEPIPIQLKVGTVDLRRINAAYDNTVQSLSARLHLGELVADVDTLDLQKLFINLDKLSIQKTTASVRLGKTEAAQAVAQETSEIAEAQAALPWRFVVDKVDIDSLHFAFDNDGMPRAPRSLDFAHFAAQDMELDAENIVVTPTVYTGRIDHFAVYESASRFNLKELRTDFSYSDTGAYLNDLYLETDKTLLRERIALSWPSLDAVTKDVGVMGLDVNIRNSVVSAREVLSFAPMLATVPPFQKAPDGIFKIDLQARGTVRDLQIADAQVSGLDATYARISGRITGLPDPVRTTYNLRIHQVRTTRGDVEKLAPAGSIPPTVRIPEAMTLQGTFVGRAADFTTNVDLRTSRGNVVAQARLVNFGERYSVNAVTNGLDVGYITKQEATMGKISARVKAEGAGFDPSTASANFSANVYAATFNGYTYKNVDASGTLRSGIAQVKVDSRDPAVALNMNATINLKNGAFPSIQGDIALDSINLQALGFYPDPLKIHGDIRINLQSTDPANLVGTVQIANGIFFANGKRFTTDTISVAAYNSADSGHVINIGSEAIVASLWGRYDLAQIGPAMMNVIHRYYNLPGYAPTAVAAQDWRLAARVIPSPLLFAFVPALQGTDTVDATVAFQTSGAAVDPSAVMRADVAAPRVAFGTIALDSVTVNADAGAASLDYGLRVAGGGNSSLKLYETTLAGDVANNAATFDLQTRDETAAPFYRIAGAANQTPNDGFRLSLSPDSLLLDGAQWTVPAGNYIEYSPAGIVAQNFSLSNSGQSLALATASTTPGSPLNATFSNFRIRTLTNFAGQDSTLADGIINGSATVTGATTATPAFTSDIAIADLSFMRDTLGNLAVRANNQTAGAISADVALSGFGNDVQLTGLYYIEGQRLDMDLAIRNIALERITTLSMGALDTAGGSLRGQVDIGGTVTAPQLVGSLQFDGAFFQPSLLGTRFTIPDDAIQISPQGFRFDTFTLLDTAGNKMVVDGNVYTTDFTDFRFGLNVDAKDFQVANAKRRGGDQTFFGSLNITTNTRLRGTMTAPVADAYLRVNKGTDLKVLLPSTNPEVDSRAGVVRFVDRDQPGAANIFNYEDTVQARSNSLVGLDVSATIETDTSALFTLIIDERTGDAVAVRGAADLVGGIDPSGKVDLNGTYALRSGSYQLTLQFLKRRFTVQPGSTITFTGDPTSGIADLTAIYVANTSALDLVENQLSGASQTELGRYKQRLPFQVLLKMRGELLKPEISFDIILPERYASQYREVDTKLASIRADEAELNKQVFALLLLNRFVDENPLQSSPSEGSAAERYVRESASRILTDQLNKLTENLIRGVDLAVGVTSGEDYSTGSLQQRTDLNVSLSKRLLNDRLRVSVGNNFELEGPRQANSQASQIAADVNIEYQLTTSGRYLVRAYRRNSYQDVVVGQAIENGAGLIATFDYDKFREVIFRTPEDKALRLQQKRQRREQKKEEKERKREEEAQKTTQGNVGAAPKRERGVKRAG